VCSLFRFFFQLFFVSGYCFGGLHVIKGVFQCPYPSGLFSDRRQGLRLEQHPMTEGSQLRLLQASTSIGGG